MSERQESPSPFPLTRWSLVVSCREQNHAALEELCRLYWKPLYTFCRRSGLGIEDSEDITQRFFHDLIESRAALLAEAGPSGGRLRTLFLRVLQRRIADHHRHAGREKRGGGGVISLETQAAEAGLQMASAAASPEEAFDRQWALSVLQLALARQEKDFAAAGRAEQFAALVPFLGMGEAESSYADVQRVLRVGESAARQAVHRFRDRFRRHLRDEVAETIADKDEAAIDRELADLRRVLQGNSGAGR